MLKCWKTQIHGRGKFVMKPFHLKSLLVILNYSTLDYFRLLYPKLILVIYIYIRLYPKLFFTIIGYSTQNYLKLF